MLVHDICEDLHKSDCMHYFYIHLIKIMFSKLSATIFIFDAFNDLDLKVKVYILVVFLLHRT